jgi:PilZ domain
MTPLTEAVPPRNDDPSILQGSLAGANQEKLLTKPTNFMCLQGNRAFRLIMAVERQGPGRAESLASDETPKRRAARYPFTARTAIQELSSKTRATGLTTDLSEGGCCVRSTEIFARGTKIELEIVKEGTSLNTPATVAFGLSPNVMGLTFGEMSDENRGVLIRWLEEAIPKMSRAMRRDGPQPLDEKRFSEALPSKRSL